GALASAVVPGKPDKSELIARVTTDVEGQLMPPKKIGKKLSDAEVATLRAWIEQGADYPTHWSYVKPARPKVPDVKDVTWANNPLDRFIQARLEAEGLKPTPAADNAAILRRAAGAPARVPPPLEEAGRRLSHP